MAMAEVLMQYPPDDSMTFGPLDFRGAPPDVYFNRHNSETLLARYLEEHRARFALGRDHRSPLDRQEAGRRPMFGEEFLELLVIEGTDNEYIKFASAQVQAHAIAMAFASGTTRFPPALKAALAFLQEFAPTCDGCRSRDEIVLHTALEDPERASLTLGASWRPLEHLLLLLGRGSRSCDAVRFREWVQMLHTVELCKVCCLSAVRLVESDSNFTQSQSAAPAGGCEIVLMEMGMHGVVAKTIEILGEAIHFSVSAGDLIETPEAAGIESDWLTYALSFAVGRDGSPASVLRLKIAVVLAGIDIIDLEPINVRAGEAVILAKISPAEAAARWTVSCRIDVLDIVGKGPLSGPGELFRLYMRACLRACIVLLYRLGQAQSVPTLHVTVVKTSKHGSKSP